MCKMFLSFSTDVYVSFLLLKHINEMHALHVDLSFTNVDIFFMCKMFLSFSTDVYVIFLF